MRIGALRSVCFSAIRAKVACGTGAEARAGVRCTVSTLHPAKLAARAITARLLWTKGILIDMARRKNWVIDGTLFLRSQLYDQPVWF